MTQLLEYSYHLRVNECEQVIDSNNNDYLPFIILIIMIMKITMINCCVYNTMLIINNGYFPVRL